MSKYTVKRITENQILEASDFLKRIIKELFDSDLGPTYHTDIIEMEDFYVKNEDHILIGAYDEDMKMVGTIGAKTYIDRFEVLNGQFNGYKTVELGRCYIDTSLRRQGIGSILLEELKVFCKERDYEKIYLHTHRHLPGGFDFWSKKGFEIIYEDPVKDIVHMELPNEMV